MLTSLHVKNLALIDEEEIAFGPGLNILSGETGAGKSIILGALTLALGGRVEKGMLRNADSEAFVEAVFSVREETAKRLEAADITAYDGEIILSRRISMTKSVARINGETVPAGKLKEAGEILLDIYGQNDHQSLQKKSRQLAMVDEYGKNEIADRRGKTAKAYAALAGLKKEYNAQNMDESARLREISFLEHEIGEITSAQLMAGEDERLEADYKRMVHSQTVSELLADSYNRLSGGLDSELEAAVRDVSQAAGYDDGVENLKQEILDAESILSSVRREIYDYRKDLAYDPGALEETERRLNLINDLKAKYGRSIELVLDTLAEKQDRLEKLNEHDAYLAGLAGRIKESEQALQQAADDLSGQRQQAAEELSRLTEEALRELNFLDASFAIALDRTESIGANGYDDVEFLISVNPGEPLRPLRQVASGGELSRMMLALKTVMATSEELECLVFDEIDAGISGRTALAVAHRLAGLAKEVQVICITHLPQIASMADTHFLIKKEVADGKTISGIRQLEEQERVGELARMLGGEDLSAAAAANARELLGEAEKYKNR